LESQKRESLDEDRIALDNGGVNIIDRASAKEARKRSQKDAAKEQKKAADRKLQQAPFQRHFNAISTSFQCHFNAISTLFQRRFNAALTPL